MPVYPVETTPFQTNATVAGQKLITFFPKAENNNFLPAE